MNILRTLFHLVSLSYARLTELNIFLTRRMVFSQLFYCSPLWSSTSKKNVSKLQSVQNFAARVVTGSRNFEHISLFLRDLNWLPVNSVLIYRVGTLKFKCVKGLTPESLCSRFVTRATAHDRNTRNKNKLGIPGYKSAAGQWSLVYRSVTMWNSLPITITDCSNLGKFKRIERLSFQLYFSNS